MTNASELIKQRNEARKIVSEARTRVEQLRRSGHVIDSSYLAAVAQLFAPGTQDADPGGGGSDKPGWFVVCAAHGTCVSTDTRKMGEWCMRHPTEFCDDCREILAARETT